MTGISFEGRVAIVTGAGGGLGRAHALDLAARGARVVVNDLGGDISGSGGGTSMADQVVQEIIRNAPFTELTPEAIEALLAVHVKGGFYVTQPAFAVMREKGYGRIVFTASAAGVFGSPEQANYAAAKSAVVGLANVVALEGAPHGIQVNTILPVSESRMIADMNPETLAGVPKTPAHREPEMITAMVSYLASEANPYTHEMFSIARGRYARVFVGVAEGHHVPYEAPVATADDVAAHIDRIRDQAGYHVPGSMVEEFSLVR
ncbi:SDR family NAD(P)-dependent oxidoreductase [Streptomyces albidoflavus]